MAKYMINRSYPAPSRWDAYLLQTEHNYLYFFKYCVGGYILKKKEKKPRSIGELAHALRQLSLQMTCKLTNDKD